jgi:lysyl-tRNA synthetase class 2
MKSMQRRAVESTTMRSVCYEAKSKVLEIEFQSGAIYQYLDVPVAVYEELLESESKGQYFNGEIRDSYAFVRANEKRRAFGG